jgi:hypothetical protein
MMTFKWSKQICQNVHGSRLINYLILLIVQCSCGKCIKKPLPFFQNLQQKSHKIIIHSFIYKWLSVTLFYICPVNTSSYIVQNSHQMIIHKHLYLLTHFTFVLAFNLKLELRSKLRTATMTATVYSELVTSLRKSTQFQSRNNWPDRHFQMKFLLNP